MKQQAIDILDEIKNKVNKTANKNGYAVISTEMFDVLIEQAKSRIQELDTSNNGWIPVTERLPYDDEEYIICTSDGLVTSMAWSTDENNWIVGITNWRIDIFGKITHWQPLIPPPNK